MRSLLISLPEVPAGFDSLTELRSCIAEWQPDIVMDNDRLTRLSLWQR